MNASAADTPSVMPWKHEQNAGIATLCYRLESLDVKHWDAAVAHILQTHASVRTRSKSFCIFRRNKSFLPILLQSVFLCKRERAWVNVNGVNYKEAITLTDEKCFQNSKQLSPKTPHYFHFCLQISIWGLLRCLSYDSNIQKKYL